jgi:hypothetical protein
MTLQALPCPRVQYSRTPQVHHIKLTLSEALSQARRHTRGPAEGKVPLSLLNSLREENY